jgi:hypothetical protein
MSAAARTVLAHWMRALCTISVRAQCAKAERSAQSLGNPLKTPGLQDMARFLLSRK